MILADLVPIWLLAGDRDSPPSPSIGAGSCRGRSVSRVALAPSPQATRPWGAPLTVIFARRQDARREEDGPPLVQARSSGVRNGGGPGWWRVRGYGGAGSGPKANGTLSARRR